MITNILYIHILPWELLKCTVNCVVCKFGSITLFSVQNSCHLLTRCIISPTGHKNISLLDKFHAGYIGCIVTCHVKCRLLACCILSGLDAHCVLLHRAASAQMTKYSPLVDILLIIIIINISVMFKVKIINYPIFCYLKTSLFGD